MFFQNNDCKGEGFTSLPKGNALLCALQSPTVLKDRFHYQVCGLLYCCLSVWPILDCLKHRETTYFSASVTRGEQKKPAFSQFRKNGFSTRPPFRTKTEQIRRPLHSVN